MLEKFWSDLHQSYFVVALAVGVIVGIILALIFRINYFASPLWIVFALMLLIWGFLYPKAAFLIVALIAGMILAFVRASVELTGEAYVRQFYDQEVELIGTVSGDLETDEGGTRLRLNNLKFGTEKKETAGEMFVTLRKNETIARSDEIRISGKMRAGFGTYVGYMYQPKVSAIRRPEPGDLVLNLRNWFAERIRRLIPEPEVNLGLSYLLGMRTGLDDKLDENLRTVGLVHIVVASGAHLSILVEIARKIFGKISRFSGLLFSVILVLAFMTMVGFTPSIMRAGIMTILSLSAWYVGRKIAPWRLILLVAAGTLMVNPSFIINLGWLLSFASFAGIMILGPKFQRLFFGTKKPGFVAGVIMTTLSATLMTLPIVLYYYGQISLISVVANLLILPTLPYAMGLVFMAGVCEGLFGLENIMAFFATKMLDFHILVVNFFGEREEFLIRIEKYQMWVFLIYGAIVLILNLTFLKNRFKRRKCGKIKEGNNINFLERKCLDIVNGKQLRGKKP